VTGENGRGASRDPGAEPGRDPGVEPSRDPELRAGFAALRRQEEQKAPAFATLWDGAVRRSRAARGRGLRRAALAAASATAALAALAVALSPWVRSGIVSPRPPAWQALSPAGRPAPSITTWRPPTDFLLRTPGEEILAQAPSFGRDAALDSGVPRPTPRR